MAGALRAEISPLFRIVLPPPMTWMATPVVSVPNAWTFASFEIVRVPPLLNSIVLPPAAHPPVT